MNVFHAHRSSSALKRRLPVVGETISAHPPMASSYPALQTAQIKALVLEQQSQFGMGAPHAWFGAVHTLAWACDAIASRAATSATAKMIFLEAMCVDLHERRWRLKRASGCSESWSVKLVRRRPLERRRIYSQFLDAVQKPPKVTPPLTVSRPSNCASFRFRRGGFAGPCCRPPPAHCPGTMGGYRGHTLTRAICLNRRP